MRSPAHQDIRSFLAHCQRVLDDRSAGRDGGDPVRRGTEALAAARATAAALPHETTTVPAIDSIDRLPTDRHNRDLVERFQTLADRLPWIPTHRADDQGRELALAPLNQAFDFGDTVVGLMYIGPGATYPLHHHPPQELYLTIAGTGRWRYGGHDHHEIVGPLSTLYNHPGDLHTATAGDHPLLALYILW